jgi:hypothetical protein
LEPVRPVYRKWLYRSATNLAVDFRGGSNAVEKCP